MDVSPETQREMLRTMQTIRRFEERASADYHAGNIYGVVHCYHRRGGGRSRRMRGAESGRPDHLDAPRPRPLHRQGRRSRPHDGRALRPRNRLLQGQGRLDAHRRFREGHARRKRHRRRRHLDRDRGGARSAAARERPRRRVLLRRRRCQCRTLSRVHQHRGRLEAPDHLRLREQRLCGADRADGDARHARCRGPRRGLRHPRASSSTATTCSRSTKRPSRLWPAHAPAKGPR